jgi:mono/diheme cytochrome c family protein
MPVKLQISFCVAALFFSCQSEKNKVEKAPKPASEIYAEKCSLCHGQDGKKGLSGAKDLSVSVLSREEAKQIISLGKNGMAGYKSILSEKEIEELANYIQSLKK